MVRLLNKILKTKSVNNDGVAGVSTLNDSVIGIIQHNRSARAKRISIQVKPSGEVRLTTPLKCDMDKALEFLHSRREWIEAARQRQSLRPAAKEYTPAQIAELRVKAKAYLPQRLKQIADHCGLKYRMVTVRTTRSKWGSCSSSGDISLSTFLITLPSHLIDFVILHELAHTVHHNHSAQFHELVNYLTNGAEKRLHQELRGYRCGVVGK